MIARDTLVIVTSDHGEALGEHGELTHGLFAYEPTLRVPLVVVDGQRPASVDNRFVGPIDIAPTVAALAGLAAQPEWKGRSLFDAGERGYTYFESLSASLNRGWAPLVGLISGGRKLIELPLPELYDLGADPGEAKNIYADDRRTAFALREILAGDAPSRTVASRGAVTSEEQAKLLALGYISGTSTKTEYTTADDPKNLIDLDNDLHEAIAAYQRGDLPRALELSQGLVKSRPDMQIGQEMLAFFLGQSERPDEAIAVLRRNVAAGRGGDAMKIRLGLMLSEEGKWGEAIAVLRPLSDRRDADLLNAYGIALADSGDIDGAVQQFQRVLEFDPESAETYQNLGIVALRAGESPRARQYLEKALSMDPKMPLALNTLGVVQAQGGDFAGAMVSWTRAVELDRNQFDALYNLGIVAVRERRNDVARKALTDYLDRAPATKFARERSRARELLAGLR